MVKNELVFKKGYKIIKYGLLIFCGIFAIYQVFPIHIGDYCSELLDVFAFVLFGGLFIFSFLIFLIVDLVRKIKYGNKFDYIPCVFLAIFIGICFLSFQIDGKKIWTDEILTTKGIQNDYLDNNTHLTLYKNGTFVASSGYGSRYCTYQGKYSINQDTLKLKRDELPKLTDKQLCTKYLICKSDCVLIPLEEGFDKIKIMFK